MNITYIIKTALVNSNKDDAKKGAVMLSKVLEKIKKAVTHL